MSTVGYEIFLRKSRLRRRFWSKVDVRGENECWLWKGYVDRGYGLFSVRYGPRRENRQRRFLAHRLAFFLTFGSFSTFRRLVLHKCGNYLCCNPRHIFQGYPQDKSDLMVKFGRTKAGADNPRAVLTARKVLKIRKARALGRSLKSLGEEFGVHLATIDYAVRGRIWPDAGGPIQKANGHKRLKVHDGRTSQN